MDNHHLRATILNLQDRLSEQDRKRLHFFLGNDVPRRIRDDPSLSGTLSLMDSLFDQDKINEQDFTLLINAFEEIQCIDAVELLREHMERMQSSGINQSMQNLASIMPTTIKQLLEDQEDDKYPMPNLLINQQSSCVQDNMMNNNKETNINPLTVIVDNQTMLPIRSKREQLFNTSWITTKCLFLLVLLLIIALGIVIGVCNYQIHRLKDHLQTANQRIQKSTNEPENCGANNEPFNTTYDKLWVEAKDGEIPVNAIVGGEENNLRVYIARFITEGNMIPGKLVERSKTAEVAYFGVRISSAYQVLTNSDPKQIFKWTMASGAVVPRGAFLAGNEGFNKLYVGRVNQSSVSLLGKYIVPHGGLFFSYAGREGNVDENFEVLILE